MNYFMILSKKEILNACKKNKLVDPYDTKLIQTCSYDLTFSGEYRIYDPKKQYNDNIKLEEGEKLIIPADAICFILTNETVNIPRNLTASISLSMGLIKSGVMLAAQPPYDAGYSGKTVALVHNLSNEPVTIKVNQHILNMVFSELKSGVSEDEKYKGKYQNASTLDDFKIRKIKGGVYELAENFRNGKNRFENSIPNLLTIITVILGILTILMTLSMPAENIRKIVSGDASNSRTPSYDNEEMTITVPESNDTKEVVIYVNDKKYTINFDQNTITEYNDDLTGEKNEE